MSYFILFILAVMDTVSALLLHAAWMDWRRFGRRRGRGRPRARQAARRPKIPPSAVAPAVYLPLTLLLSLLLPGVSPAHILLQFALCLIWCLAFWAGPLLGRLAAAALFTVLVAGGDLLSLAAAQRLCNVGYYRLQQSPLLLALATTLCKPLLLIACYALYRVAAPSKGLARTWRSWLRFLPLPLGVLAFVLFAVAYLRQNDAINPQLLAVDLLLLAAMVLYLCQLLRADAAVKDANTLLQLYRQNERQLTAQNKAQRRELHDVANFTVTVQKLAQQGCQQELLALTGQLLHQYEQAPRRVATGNAVVDCVLNDQYAKAEMDGIRLQISICPLEDLAMQELDLVLVLANLLDNARHACAALPGPQREIAVQFTHCQDQVLLTVQNRCAAAPRPQSGTRGALAPMHGYGRGIVDKTVRKYGSRCMDQQGDGWYRVDTLLPLAVRACAGRSAAAPDPAAPPGPAAAGQPAAVQAAAGRPDRAAGKTAAGAAGAGTAAGDQAAKPLPAAARTAGAKTARPKRTGKGPFALSAAGRAAAGKRAAAKPAAKKPAPKSAAKKPARPKRPPAPRGQQVAGVLLALLVLVCDTYVLRRLLTQSGTHGLPGDSGVSYAASENLPGTAAPQPTQPQGLLRTLAAPDSTHLSAYTQEGFYYISRENDLGSGANIKYIDFDTRQELFLCQKPGCTHTTESCQSYFASKNGNALLFVAGRQLLLVSTHSEDQWVKVRGLDGSGERQLLAPEAPARLDTDTFFADDAYLYYVTVQDGASTLNKVEIATGKQQPLCGLPAGYTLAGSTGQYFLATVLNYATGNVTVHALDVAGKPVETLYFPTSHQLERDRLYCTDSNLLYQLSLDPCALTQYDLFTGESRTLGTDYPFAAYGSSLWLGAALDGVVPAYAMDERGGSYREFFYLLDLNTGTLRENPLTYLDSTYHQRRPVNFVAETGDCYLVRCGSYTAGGWPVDNTGGFTAPYAKPQYAFIAKQAYLNGEEVYQLAG